MHSAFKTLLRERGPRSARRGGAPAGGSAAAETAADDEGEGSRRPPSHWAVIAAYALVAAATQMLWLTYAAITTTRAHRYGVWSSAVGWLAEIFPLLYVVLAIPAGTGAGPPFSHDADRRGRVARRLGRSSASAERSRGRWAVR